MGEVITGKNLRVTDVKGEGLCLVNSRTGRVVLGLKEFEVDIKDGVDGGAVVLVKFYASEPHEKRKGNSDE